MSLNRLFVEGYSQPSAETLRALREAGFPRLRLGDAQFASLSAGVPPPLRPGFLEHVCRLLLSSAPLVTVKQLPSTHPAHSAASVSVGLFAAVDIPAFTPFAVYSGELIEKEDDAMRGTLSDGSVNPYVFEINTEGPVAFLVDGAIRPRSVASCLNHYEGIIDEPNATTVSVLCGGGCRCHSGAFPEITHPHVIIYSACNIPAGTELCISYGKSYWKDMGINPAGQSTLLSRVLASDLASREAILEALIRQQNSNVSLTIQDTGETDYMELLRASPEPRSTFVNCLQIIGSLSGNSFRMSAGVCVGNADRGFGFPLLGTLTGGDIFDVAFRGNLEHAALFLTRVRRCAMTPAEPQILNGHLILGPEDSSEDEGEEDDTPAPKRPRIANGFICYGKAVQWDDLESAYQERTAIEPESTRGFWSRLADDIGIPNHATATGRSGVIHKRYCDHFKHPFV